MNQSKLYVEKKAGYDTQSQNLLADIKENLGIQTIANLRVINRYYIQGLTEKQLEKASKTIFSEPNIDNCNEKIENLNTDITFGIKALDGQYDARASFAEECLKIMDSSIEATVKCASVYILSGDITEQDLTKIKEYLINPVESKECAFDEDFYFNQEVFVPKTVETVDNFTKMSEDELENFRKLQGFAMTLEDIKLIQKYFAKDRNPTITELKVIDTYWSDHCRHTTFMTKLNNVKIEDETVQKAFDEYISIREKLGRTKEICLMDIATISAKYLKSIGKLDDIDESEEINACSINITVDVDSVDEPWVLMFKNETHNHPTEIEPFGGASTCLGGAIRDPLSGRSYVFSAMRVTGAGNPKTPFDQTIKGKLPQKMITKKAAAGYSSYGNQIGLATGGVYEIYDEGYVAKRMEVGAVMGAAPKKNIVREKPQSGDVILVLGGKTGRDGIGGATGSSKVHDTTSTEKCSSEVQKGNPIIERKIQRLFRNESATTLIKKCNDFGAGGVCVAIGELADSLEINLNSVTKKYEGLDGTEIAISESQERMAVVISSENVEKFTKLCEIENLEVKEVAKVTDSGRLVMMWNDTAIFDVSREFLDTNGATASTDVIIEKQDYSFFDENLITTEKETLLENLSRLNVCSKKGLAENFDSTIGAGTVLMPFGGKNMITEPDGMVQKIPLIDGITTQTAMMTYGYNPALAKKSTYLAGIYAVLESVSKIVALGGDYKKVRLSLQEYFERMVDEKAYGKPTSAILGAMHAGNALGASAIGGKDSMSGNFEDLKVPPTIISFAVGHEKVDKILSPEFKQPKSKVLLVKVKTDENYVPDFVDLTQKYESIYKQNQYILSAKTVSFGGITSAVAKMCLGNDVGFKYDEANVNLSTEYIGALILEVSENFDEKHAGATILGHTTIEPTITFANGESVPLDECKKAFTEPLESVFKTKVDGLGEVYNIEYKAENRTVYTGAKATPNVFIPAFPGTNCEFDTAKAFKNVGAKTDILVFKNLKPSDIDESIDEMVKRINNSQIFALPGGFSASDEPDGSAKFIATVLRNERICEAINEMLYKRDGLMIGICNGFQALVKLGLLPYGEICDLKEGMPTLTFNNISRHISMMANTKIMSNKSPWLANVNVGDVHSIAMSHGEGKFVASDEVLAKLIENGQIATQYVDNLGNATMNGTFNPNGSTMAIEGITSIDGRILGKMGHSERICQGLYKNIAGNKDQKIFVSGVEYFTK